jgi:hypothetical protein
MGVTLYFSGTIRNIDDPKLEQLALKWAKRWGCEVNSARDTELPSVMVRNEEVIEEIGPLDGFSLNPHKDCESVRILVRKDGYFQHFCKTQFAGPDTHIEIVEFLRELAPFVEDFDVLDEGKYWNTGDRNELERRMDLLDQAIDSLAEKLGDAVVPSDHTPKTGMN